MVQITMQLPGASPESCPEWVIVDVQGNLETRKAVPLSGKFIGDLHFTNTNIPVLIVGHHILYGKVVEMEKPFAVLTKSKKESQEADVTMETEDANLSDSRETTYIVKAIVKRKLLFKTRPKPIIAHVPKTV